MKEHLSDDDEDDLEANSAAEEEQGPRDDGFLDNEDVSSVDEDFDPEKYSKDKKKKKRRIHEEKI